jgi:hypothetical protein
MWNQGVHARSGVACADCHMPYMRRERSRSPPCVRSPLLNVARACRPVIRNGSRNDRTGKPDPGTDAALMDQPKRRSWPSMTKWPVLRTRASASVLAPALALRQAVQVRLCGRNSMGFRTSGSCTDTRRGHRLCQAGQLEAARSAR